MRTSLSHRFSQGMIKSIRPVPWRALPIVLSAAMAACAPAPMSWTEEVDVTGFGTVSVARHETYSATQPLGSVESVWIKRSTLRVVDAKVSNPPGELDTAEFMVRFDFDPKLQEWYAITFFERCREASRVGLKDRPYFEYRWTGTEWNRMPLTGQRIGLVNNLLLTKSLAKRSRNVRLGDKRIADQNIGLADHLRMTLDRVPC
jgi:hypothetical protein